MQLNIWSLWCFPLLWISFIFLEWSLKACVNIHQQSVSKSRSSKVQQFSRTAAAFFKERDTEEKVYSGPLLQRPRADVRDESVTVNQKNHFKTHKTRRLTRWLLWCVLVFHRVRTRLLAGDKPKLSAGPQRHQTPGPGHQHHQRCVCLCVCVLVRMHRCACLCGWGCGGSCVFVCLLNPRSPKALLSLQGSFYVWFHVSVLVSIRLCVGWKYDLFVFSLFPPCSS